MRFKYISCIFVILIVLMLVPGTGFTECDENSVEVTIVQVKAGKVMAICVNEAALPHIGGPGDIVIPAACPCNWDLAELLFLDCLSVPIRHCYAFNHDTHDEVGIYLQCGSPDFSEASAQYAWITGEGFCAAFNSISGRHVQEQYLTPLEAKACAAQVWEFAVHELGLDCVGEFPDFEPPPTP